MFARKNIFVSQHNVIDYAMKLWYTACNKTVACGRNPDCRWFSGIFDAGKLTKLLTEQFLDVIKIMDECNVQRVKHIHYISEK